MAVAPFFASKNQGHFKHSSQASAILNDIAPIKQSVDVKPQSKASFSFGLFSFEEPFSHDIETRFCLFDRSGRVLDVLKMR